MCRNVLIGDINAKNNVGKNNFLKKKFKNFYNIVYYFTF